MSWRYRERREEAAGMLAAIAEAIFMLGFEAKCDKVKSVSFAPMLNNANGTTTSGVR